MAGMTLPMLALEKPSMVRAVVASSARAELSALKRTVLSAPSPFDNLVFELQNQPLGTLEANSLYAFDPVYVLCEDGLSNLFRAERGQHHPGRGHPDSGHADEQAEQFPLVFGGKTVKELFVLPDIVVDIGYRLVCSWKAS